MALSSNSLPPDRTIPAIKAALIAKNIRGVQKVFVKRKNYDHKQNNYRNFEKVVIPVAPFEKKFMGDRCS